MADDYGALAGVVAVGGSIMAAGAALGLAWRGKRTRWEPAQQDVPGSGEKVAALLASIAVALIFAGLNDQQHVGALTVIAVLSGVLAFISLMAYGLLIGILGFDRFKDTDNQYRIIGGFSLTREAKVAHQDQESVQLIFEGLAYDPERVWTRPSRAVARTVCQGFFILLLVTGTVALGATSVRLGIAIS